MHVGRDIQLTLCGGRRLLPYSSVCWRRHYIAELLVPNAAVVARRQRRLHNIYQEAGCYVKRAGICYHQRAAISYSKPVSLNFVGRLAATAFLWNGSCYRCNYRSLPEQVG